MGQPAIITGKGPLAFFKGLSKKTWIIIGCVAVTILVVIIVVPVEVAKENAYPNYNALNYTLSETYSGEDFFDNFEYFTDTGVLSSHPVRRYLHLLMACSRSYKRLCYICRLIYSQLTQSDLCVQLECCASRRHIRRDH